MLNTKVTAISAAVVSSLISAQAAAVQIMPISGVESSVAMGGLMMTAALSLLIGIRIVKRKADK